MRYVKIAGVAWGLIYFAVGALTSFTLNNVDFWSSIAILFAMFLLPLPIALVAVWFPKIAGKALLGRIGIDAIAIASIITSHRPSDFGELARFAGIFTAYHLPHLLWGIGYINMKLPSMSGD